MQQGALLVQAPASEADKSSFACISFGGLGNRVVSHEEQMAAQGNIEVKCKAACVESGGG